MPEKEEDIWLPEDFVLKLTALEAGALMMALDYAKSMGLGWFQVMRPGFKEPKPMIDVLLEKIEQVRVETYGER